MPTWVRPGSRSRPRPRALPRRSSWSRSTWGSWAAGRRSTATRDWPSSAPRRPISRASSDRISSRLGSARPPRRSPLGRRAETRTSMSSPGWCPRFDRSSRGPTAGPMRRAASWCGQASGSSIGRASNVSYARTRANPGLVDKVARLSPGLGETIERLLDDEYLWDEVVSVADAGQELTYDFTVPDVHAFIANGIVSHNSGGKTRRAAKMVILDVGHPDILDFIDSKKLEEKKAWALIEQGYDPSFTGEAYGSVSFQNANHSVRVTDEFMRAVEAGGGLDHARGGGRGPHGHPQGARHLPANGGGRPRLRRSGHPVRHHHQRVEPCLEHGPPVRNQPLQRIHLFEQFLMQFGLAEPHAVRRRGRRARRGRVPLRLPPDDHGPGDPRRQRAAIRRRRSRRTATVSGRWAWATRTWARSS